MWKITKIWTFLVSVLSCLRYIQRGRDWLTAIQKFQLLSFVIFLQFLHVSLKKAKVYQHKDFFIIFILFNFLNFTYQPVSPHSCPPSLFPSFFLHHPHPFLRMDRAPMGSQLFLAYQVLAGQSSSALYQSWAIGCGFKNVTSCTRVRS